jgi:hypothetical protein
LVFAAESALYDVVALLDAPTAAKAEPLAAEFLEYLDAMDYNKYFDAMPTRMVSLLPCMIMRVVWIWPECAGVGRYASAEADMQRVSAQACR